jgi:hypothetical protein
VNVMRCHTPVARTFWRLTHLLRSKSCMHQRLSALSKAPPEILNQGKNQVLGMECRQHQVSRQGRKKRPRVFVPVGAVGEVFDYFLATGTNSRSISATANSSKPSAVSISNTSPLGVTQTMWLPRDRTSRIFGWRSSKLK